MRRSLALASRALLAAALPLSIACTDRGTPTGPFTPPPPQAPAVPTFPPLARAAEVYVEEVPLYGPTASHGGPRASRFALYLDGTFGLQFAGWPMGFFEYRGRVTRAEGGLAFAFDGGHPILGWRATGRLTGDRMSVSYDDIMVMSDFVDGVYVRVAEP